MVVPNVSKVTLLPHDLCGRGCVLCSLSGQHVPSGQDIMLLHPVVPPLLVSTLKKVLPNVANDLDSNMRMFPHSFILAVKTIQPKRLTVGKEL